MNEKDKETLAGFVDILMIEFGYKPNFKLVVAKKLDLAYSDVLGYTNREALTGNMESSVYDIAVVRLNMMGNEGETSRSEGGVSQSFETGIPKSIKSALNRYRVGRLGSLL